jgi:predicted nucleotidyltransferase
MIAHTIYSFGSFKNSPRNLKYSEILDENNDIFKKIIKKGLDNFSYTTVPQNAYQIFVRLPVSF